MNPDWQWYERYGLRVFPVIGVRDNGTCRCSSGRDCTSPGKHPKFSGWQQIAGTAEAYERWREGDNLGAATGDGLVVFDWDGPTTLQRPPTLASATPSGGEHWYFHSSRAVRNGVKIFDGVLDVRGQGGFVVLPPSVHVNGGQYRWIDLSLMANLPSWSRTVLPQERVRDREPQAWPASDPDEESVLWADVMDQLVHELSQAQSGERNNALFKASCQVTEMICSGNLNKDRLREVADVGISIGLSRNEVQRTVESAVRRVTGA